MTQEEAQIRNWKISQLIGILPRLNSLIPEDIKEQMQPRDMKQFVSFADRLLECINDSKVKRFTCEKCNPIHGKETKNKRAYHCDFCGNWEDKLYTVKSKKEIEL